MVHHLDINFMKEHLEDALRELRTIRDRLRGISDSGTDLTTFLQKGIKEEHWFIFKKGTVMKQDIVIVWENARVHLQVIEEGYCKPCAKGGRPNDMGIGELLEWVEFAKSSLKKNPTKELEKLRATAFEAGALVYEKFGLEFDRHHVKEKMGIYNYLLGIISKSRDFDEIHEKIKEGTYVKEYEESANSKIIEDINVFIKKLELILEYSQQTHKITVDARKYLWELQKWKKGIGNVNFSVHIFERIRRWANTEETKFKLGTMESCEKL